MTIPFRPSSWSFRDDLCRPTFRNAELSFGYQAFYQDHDLSGAKKAGFSVERQDPAARPAMAVGAGAIGTGSERPCGDEQSPSLRLAMMVGGAVYYGPGGDAMALRVAFLNNLSVCVVDLDKLLPPEATSLVEIGGQEATARIGASGHGLASRWHSDCPDFDAISLRGEPRSVVTYPQGKDWSKHPLWDLPMQVSPSPLMARGVLEIGGNMTGPKESDRGEAPCVGKQPLAVFVEATGCDLQTELLMAMAAIWGTDNEAKRKWLEERCDPLGGKPAELLRNGRVGKVIGFLQQAV